MNNNETTPYMSGVNAMFGGSNYLDVQLNAQNNPNTQINANYSTEKQGETSGTFVQNGANSDVHSAAGYNTPDTQNSNQNGNNQNINTGTTGVQNKVIDTSTQDNATKVLTAMINGEDVAYTDDKGVAIDMAKKRYNSLQGLIGMTDDALATYLDTADITLAHDLQKYYPERYASVMNNITKGKQLDSINQLASSLYNAYGGDSGRSGYGYTESKLDNGMTLVQTAFGDYLFNSGNDDKLQQIMDKYANYGQYAVDTYKTLMNTPEIRGYKNSIAKLSEQVNSLQEDINNIGDDVRERLGSSAPESLVSAYISQETKKLQKQLNSANIALSTAQTSYKMAAGEAEQLMDYYMKGYEYEMAAAEMGLKYSGASLVGSNGGSGGLTSSQVQKMIEDAKGNQPNYDLIAQDIIEGRFAWSTSADAMSRYGFISAVDDDELAAQVGEALTRKGITMDIASNVIPEANLSKVRSALQSKSRNSLLAKIAEKGTATDYKKIGALLHGVGADEGYAVSVMNEANISDKIQNDVLTYMGLGVKESETNSLIKDSSKNRVDYNKIALGDMEHIYNPENNIGQDKVLEDAYKAGMGAYDKDELVGLLGQYEDYNPAGYIKYIKEFIDKKAKEYKVGDTYDLKGFFENYKKYTKLNNFLDDINKKFDDNDYVKKYMEDALKNIDAGQKAMQSVIDGYVSAHKDTWTKEIRSLRERGLENEENNYLKKTGLDLFSSDEVNNILGFNLYDL